MPRGVAVLRDIGYAAQQPDPPARTGADAVETSAANVGAEPVASNSLIEDARQFAGLEPGDTHPGRLAPWRRAVSSIGAFQRWLAVSTREKLAAILGSKRRRDSDGS